MWSFKKRQKLRYSFFFLSILLTVYSSLFLSTLFAQEMTPVLRDATIQLSNKTDKFAKEERLVVTVVNKHLEKGDDLANRIETALYLSLQDQFPQVKLILLEEASHGIPSSGTVFIKGIYEKKGEEITLQLNAIKGILTGELLAQTKVSFSFGSIKEKSMVAILDIDGSILTQDERLLYSEIFRSTIISTGAFEVVSAAEVSKMDPDEVQRVQKCTRDECATIIGEQLGVDRVISTTIYERNQNKFLLAGKLISIKDHKVIKSVMIRHHGNKDSLDTSLEDLAFQLANGDRVDPLKSDMVWNEYGSSKKPLWFGVLAGISAFYAYNQYSQATKEVEAMNESDGKISAASSLGEAETYDKEASDHSDKAVGAQR